MSTLLTLCMLGNSACNFTSVFFFIFLNQLFQKQSFRNTIRVSDSLDPNRPDVLLSLIWVQTVCKGYQQTTKVATSGESIKNYKYCYNLFIFKE